MTISPESDGSALVRYWFRGYGDDGETEVKYGLKMNGTFTGPGNWRPDLGEASKVELAVWSMNTEGNKNRQISCKDVAGAFDQKTEVKRINQEIAGLAE